MLAPVCSTISLLDEAAVGVDAGAVVLLLGLLLAEPQDVLQAVQSHLDDLGVHHRQQVAQGLDAAQVHQVSARTAARRGREFSSRIGSVSAVATRQVCKANERSASPRLQLFFRFTNLFRMFT